MNSPSVYWVVVCCMLIIAGCQSENRPQVFVATSPPEDNIRIAPTVTRTLAPVSPTPLVTLTPVATLTLPATETVAVIPTQAPERVERFALIRPIRISNSNTQRDFVDRTYPYGDTQGGTRQTHSGVEFLNPTGTTVLAAEAGRVVFAGTDDTTLIGPRNGFYGNVVVIEHDDLQSPSGEPVYTVYAHLSRILVVNDGIITRGTPIGEVGDSGIAVGPHLHFEVRVGPDPFDYNATRNPDLWLHPYAGAGVLAGRLTDGTGQLLPGITIDIRSVRTNNLLFAFTYAPDTVNSDIAWQENFTRGDLPAGQYIVTVAQDGDVRFQQRIMIQDQKITWLDIVLE